MIFIDFGLLRRFYCVSFNPLGSRSPPYECIKFGYPLQNARFLLLSSSLARERLQIDTDLLRIITRTAAKYLTYLLKSTEVIQIWEFDNLHMTQCAKIIVGFMANGGNVFIQHLQTFFYFLHVF